MNVGFPEPGQQYAPATTGRNYNIKVLSPQQNGTAYNSYQVLPDAQATSVAHLVPPDWKEKLDKLESFIPGYMPEDEQKGYLTKMGFPQHNTAAGAATSTTPMAPAAPQVAPAVGPAPVAVASPGSAPVAVPAPTAAPQPAATLAPAGAPVGVAGGAGDDDPLPFESPAAAAPSVPMAPVTAAPVVAAGTTSYPYAQGKAVPEGAPVCFGDFDTTKHPCDNLNGAPCPVLDKCQIRTVGMD
jgi:hypothetical protein